jgi:uncharacterized protein (TIGR02996 family)
MRTFVRASGKERAFWNILLHQGSSPGFTVSSGTTGRGKQQVTEYQDRAAPRTEYDRLIVEKLAEGFVETTDAPWHRGFDSPLRQTLEQALVEDPDDLATHMAYADHLTELGDPRGEFVAVQIALEDETVAAAERKKLRRREKALLDRHGRDWLGHLAGFWLNRLDTFDWTPHRLIEDPNDLGWRRGWINALWFDGCSPHIVDAVRRSLPQLRCLRELRLLGGHYDYDHSGYSELSGIDFFGNVRFFQVGDHRIHDSFVRETISPRPFYKKMPRLEELHLYCWDTPFGESFPHLRQLTAHHGLEVYDLAALAANKSLKNLTHLSCWPRGFMNDEPEEPNEDGGFARITRSGAAALFRSRNLPELRHLQLRNSDIGDAGIRDLIKSGLLRRLKTLDLLGGRVTDVGARLLAACPELRNLEALDLSENMITRAGVAALTETGVPLTANRQHGPDALESLEYLYSGDCE